MLVVEFLYDFEITVETSGIPDAGKGAFIKLQRVRKRNPRKGRRRRRAQKRKFFESDYEDFDANEVTLSNCSIDIGIYGPFSEEGTYAEVGFVVCRIVVTDSHICPLSDVKTELCLNFKDFIFSHVTVSGAIVQNVVVDGFCEQTFSLTHMDTYIGTCCFVYSGRMGVRYKEKPYC